MSKVSPPLGSCWSGRRMPLRERLTEREPPSRVRRSKYVYHIEFTDKLCVACVAFSQRFSEKASIMEDIFHLKQKECHLSLQISQVIIRL